ncbi:DUF2924 domain-containing protein [Litorivicinus lipolyticus]|uniref:DUF2924 domain-containing protein n=1 Tax=Litorivicinus lipolyticus TaxID=418701 RepID=A0A5Q2Q8T7_9GAMM|nr:DUF2924 domain-containing protein [Litorivicinus lipolyticus]QGG80588.1 DUF2924 domain-containing protein [Litorivicinus lipolyticus]
MNRKHNPVAIPSSVIEQIVGLKEMPFEDLKSFWLEVYQTEPPTNRRPYLERRLAYKLQENVYRQQNPALLERNQKRIEQLLKDTGNPRAAGKIVPEPGTVLIREYQEERHEVTVTLEGAFDYKGTLYSSLSEIARLITGTRWSGPVFFGLRSASKPSKKGGAK